VNFGAQRGRDEPVVDVTPLIDIIFQLVLFFMVSTTFITSQGIQVDLPRSSADAILRESGDLRVKVTSDGAIYLDEDPVGWTALRSAVADAARSDPSTLVVIKADKEVDHGRVVAVMDLARTYGLGLAIATEANTEDGGGDGAVAPTPDAAP
jgi:biopolymer transport protein ExbD